MRTDTDVLSDLDYCKGKAKQLGLRITIQGDYFNLYEGKAIVGAWDEIQRLRFFLSGMYYQNGRTKAKREKSR